MIQGRKIIDEQQRIPKYDFKDISSKPSNCSSPSLYTPVLDELMKIILVVHKQIKVLQNYCNDVCWMCSGCWLLLNSHNIIHSWTPSIYFLWISFSKIYPGWPFPFMQQKFLLTKIDNFNICPNGKMPTSSHYQDTPILPGYTNLLENHDMIQDLLHTSPKASFATLLYQRWAFIH